MDENSSSCIITAFGELEIRRFSLSKKGTVEVSQETVITRNYSLKK
jgi:hypothetical protein